MIYVESEYSCEDTSDRVYLLSYDDYRFSDYRFSSDGLIRWKTTDFARARGALSDNGWYWTRSPNSDYSDHACSVNYYGYVSDYGNHVSDSSGCVRPALTISI